MHIQSNVVVVVLLLVVGGGVGLEGPDITLHFCFLGKPKDTIIDQRLLRFPLD